MEEFKQEIIQKIDYATSQILNSVGELMAKTIAAIKTNFDIKLAAITENRAAVQSAADMFTLEPVSSKAELYNLEENLQTPEFEEQVVSLFLCSQKYEQIFLKYLIWYCNMCKSFF